MPEGEEREGRGGYLVVMLASYGGVGVRGGVQVGFVGIVAGEGSCGRGGESCRRLTGKEGKWKHEEG